MRLPGRSEGQGRGLRSNDPPYLFMDLTTSRRVSRMKTVVYAGGELASQWRDFPPRTKHRAEF
jgi:hypothetical protein